jgi:CheY-like chemotaxis protein
MVKKILLIDDSPPAIGMIKDLLVREGYDVITANNGEEGIKKSQESHFDLVVTDTVMPGMNGFEVCRQIKRITNQKPPKVIVMTGTMGAVNAGKAKEVGADEYCAKTKDCLLILEAVKHLI